MARPIAIGQRAAAEQLLHTFRPPALYGIALIQQLGYRSFAADEHNALRQQLGGEDIPVSIKTLLRKQRVIKKIKGLLQAGHGSGAGQRLGSHGPGQLEAFKLSIRRGRRFKCDKRSLMQAMVVLNRVIAVINCVFVGKRRVQRFGRESNKEKSDVLVQNEITLIYTI